MQQNQSIGLITGGGTGPELAAVFRSTIDTIVSIENLQPVRFLSFEETFGYRPCSFWELNDKDSQDAEQIIRRNCQDLESFYDLAVTYRAVGVFRTAINAETLYKVRRNTQTIKALPLTIQLKGSHKRILFIRDQMQGFYAQQWHESANRNIGFSGEFSKECFTRLSHFVRKITEDFGYSQFKLLFIYKYHLFGLQLERLISDSIKACLPSAALEIVQPDTGMHYLLGELENTDPHENLVVVCGNEVGDVLLEALIHYYHLGTKETTFTSNFALAKGGLEILQTMHGSADKIAGLNAVNPTATIRAAAHALEHWLSVPNAIERMNNALKMASERGVRTRDAGGTSTTTDVVAELMLIWQELSSRKLQQPVLF